MTGEHILDALAERAHVLRVTMVVDEMDELRRFVLAKLRG
jgi:hypothetical protein